MIAVSVIVLLKANEKKPCGVTNPLIYHKIHKVLVKNTFRWIHFEGTDNGSYRLSVGLSVKQEAGDKET